MKIIYSLLLVVGFIQTLSAQLLIHTENRFFVGGQAGVSFTFGTHQNRLGLIIKGFAGYNFVQMNGQVAFYKNFYSIGANQSTWEGQARLSVLGSWGRRDTLRAVLVNEVSNQTLKPNAAAYGYIWYWDKQGTSQHSGLISFQSRKFQFVMENDLFSFLVRDRYRTGAIALSYLLPTNTRISLKHISYTGDAFIKGHKWVRDNINFPGPYGYMDTENVPFGNKSIGSLTVGVEQALPYFQQANFDMGIDAEQIRNLLQNRFIHDNLTVPAHWVENSEFNFEGKNPRIPMLDRDNKPYVYKKEQKIRRPKFFSLLSLNGSWFY